MNAIEIFVNGDARQVPAGSTIADLVAAAGWRPAQVAVERNKELVPRAQHAATVLAAGDRLEIVTFFGGG